MPDEESSVKLEDVTQAAVSGVMRALDARNPDTAHSHDFPSLPWPIIIGLILNPGQPFLSATPQESDDEQSAGGE